MTGTTFLHLGLLESWSKSQTDHCICYSCVYKATPSKECSLHVELEDCCNYAWADAEVHMWHCPWQTKRWQGYLGQCGRKDSRRWAVSTVKGSKTGVRFFQDDFFTIVGIRVNETSKRHILFLSRALLYGRILSRKKIQNQSQLFSWGKSLPLLLKLLLEFSSCWNYWNTKTGSGWIVGAPFSTGFSKYLTSNCELNSGKLLKSFKSSKKTIVDEIWVLKGSPSWQ